MIGASFLSIFSLSFSPLRSGVLETPVRFTWLQTSSSGFNVLLYELGFVGWQPIHRQMHRLVAIAHRPLEQLDGQLAVEAASIGRISVGCFRVDRGCGADRLPLAGPRNHRSLALPGPGFAMHGVGPKARFVPEIHFTAYSFRRSGNGWIRFALPAFNRFRVAWISSFERLPRCKSKLGELLANRSQAEMYGKLLLDQAGDRGSCPETKIQTALASIFAVDPGKHLFLLTRCQRARTPS